MAGELLTTFDSGTMLYAVVFDATGAVFNVATSALEAINAANWTQYAVPLSEQSGAGIYRGDFPVGITTGGLFRAVVYQQSGGSPAVGDRDVATGIIHWNGAVEIGFVNAGDAYEPEPGLGVRQVLSLLLAATTGRTSGFQGIQAVSGATFKAPDGVTARVVADTDANGNRTTITLTPPA